ncbi:MAG: MBL fold metallo-hydrolase [Chloroflexota bacterium]|nr:MBL fold metallo-hydrolase [Chloroflexota bacterium]
MTPRTDTLTAVPSRLPPGQLSAKVLASGSSGNCLLVQSATTTLLVDLGITARTAASTLAGRGVPPEAVDAILLSHEHSDHVIGVGAFSRRYGTPVIAAPKTLDAAEAMVGAFRRQPLALGSTVTVGDCDVSSFPVPHDAAAPSGFLIRSGGWTIVYCVDLGTASETLHEPLAAADLLILEANHDYDTLRTGPYAESLKARLLSPLGHLSNLEAARLIVGSANGRPRTVWLAHLSAINNSPRLAKRIVGSILRREGITGVRLEVAARDTPSLFWSSETVGWQLALPT